MIVLAQPEALESYASPAVYQSTQSFVSLT